MLFTWITFLRDETLRLIGCGRQFEVTLHHHHRRARSNGSFNSRDVAEPSSPLAECPKFQSSKQLQSRQKNHHRHGHHGTETTLDQRAVFVNSCLRDKDVLFNFLVEYNKERIELEFQREYHTCDVCFSDKAGTEFIRLFCGHFFCKVCMNGCYSTHIKEGGIDSVKCLAVKCTGVPTVAQVLEIVGKDLFERYDSILLQVYFICWLIKISI